jgi:hypothetical protein
MPDCCGPRTQLGKKVSYCVWAVAHQKQFFTKFLVIVCAIRLSTEGRERLAVVVVVVAWWRVLWRRYGAMVQEFVQTH